MNTVCTSGAGWLLAASAAVSLVVAGGTAVLLARARRRQAKVLEDRRWLLEREREAAARTAVAAERARIARELHDIVSHKVSLMVVQATAAREVLATLPNAAETALQAVEGAGRDAMTELRHLLGLLAPSPDGDDDDPSAQYGEGDLSGLAPQPSLSQLGTLVDRIAFAGLPVEVRISGEPRPLPPGIDVTAYRIIQEALTNALKYGDGGKATVTVRYAGHSLRVEVLNSGPSVLSTDSASMSAGSGHHSREDDGAGRGLIGLRERVAVYDGHFDARRRIGGGYRVRARIPLERP
ncbi:histidine kinase/DNA gyrase B/HSP90-like ATPase [Streptomyces sp. Ag82_O1-15]|jgi:signal transduction histidine kinase|uniref:sensor histidine kinase n=1 Tax=Streptomyces sp. Ag82_O1-15 TaxID=1938855 RepID=UPI000BB0DBFA|nr:histidine kinase/DNA gyrase B/HSP90-like ATPase [Streptomyces sp. Ag82_O1-15]